MAENLGRGFVFIAVLLFTFTYLVASAPSSLISVDQSEYNYQDIPDSWVAEELATWGETFANWGNITVLQDSGENQFKIGDIDFSVLWIGWDMDGDGVGEDPLYFRHRVIVLGGILSFYHDTHESPVKRDFVLRNIVQADPETSRFPTVCDDYTFFASVTHNATKFDTLEEAYDGNDSYDPEVIVFVGVGWEAEIGSANAWNVVSQLLTFSLPDIHPALNVLIGASLWTCILYLCYRLIIMVIPFISGG